MEEALVEMFRGYWREVEELGVDAVVLEGAD